MSVRRVGIDTPAGLRSIFGEKKGFFFDFLARDLSKVRGFANFMIFPLQISWQKPCWLQFFKIFQNFQISNCDFSDV